MEKTSAYKKQFPGAKVSENKLANDKEIRAGFKDRNGNIIGNKYATMETISNLKRSFMSPESNRGYRNQVFGETSSAQSKVGSARSLAIKYPTGYKSALDGKTTYKDTFVDHHIKHCHCPN